MPARAPASIDMLQMVRRCSTDMPRIAGPAYSSTWPAPPPAPIVAMIARITSLPDTPNGSTPSTWIRMTFGFFCQRVCVASTWATSEAPMPKASAPSRHASRCGCRRRRASCRAGSGPARDRRRARCPGADRRGRTAGCRARAVLLSSCSILLRTSSIGDELAALSGRHIVVRRREGEVGAPHRAPIVADHLERMERAVMHEVAIDVEEGLAARPDHAPRVGSTSSRTWSCRSRPSPKASGVRPAAPAVAQRSSYFSCSSAADTPPPRRGSGRSRRRCADRPAGAACSAR